MNRALNAFVTRSAFNLTLGHTHLDLLLDLGYAAEDGRYKSIYIRHPGVKGLELRGLIEHAKHEHKPGEVELVWKLTRAGELVHGLLVEAAVFPDNQFVQVLPHISDDDEAEEIERNRKMTVQEWRQRERERAAIEEAHRLKLGEDLVTE
jgi:hypothetical protein